MHPHSDRPELSTEIAPKPWWVLRGGRLDIDSTLRNHDRVYGAYGLHGVCATAGQPLEDAERALRGYQRVDLHALVGELDSVGCLVVREPHHDWPDALILFGDEPTAEHIDALRGVFYQRETRLNPRGRRREGQR